MVERGKKVKTVLITGATGFLGKNLISAFLKKDYFVIGTGHSENNIKECERKFGNKVTLYSVDISTSYLALKNIIKKHSVDYIVHAAALKHVGICENNPTRAVEVNIVGSQNIIKAAMECDVKNVIGISTDKAINPLCVYGITKKIMEEMFLEYNFGIFQGVNFLFSTGSVLDIWDKLRIENKPILANTTAIRYFCLINEVCERLVDSVGCKERFSVERCYEISILNLQKAFSKYHDYWNVEEHTPLSVEKIQEELPLKQIKILNPKIGEIVSLFRHHYNGGE